MSGLTPFRVLVATDGSDDARAAAQWLAHVPLPAASRVVALAVATLPPSSLDIPTVRDLYRALRDEARRAADEVRALLGSGGREAETEVRDGDPREAIVEAAEELQADLLVLGARGLGAVAGVLLGSVSSTVARHAPCAVLVAKGSPRPLRTVLVAVDGSPDALHAADFLASLPLDRSLRVRLVGVVELPRLPASPAEVIGIPFLKGMGDLVKERRAALDGVLAGMAARLEPRVGGVERRLPVGRPGEEIVRAASEPGVDLVVVGRRGLGGLKRLLLGSVSETVLRQAECPVLIVKGV